MKKVKMLVTKKGSPDGVTVNEYQKGEVYTIPASLADVFISEKWAKAVKPSQKVETPKVETPEDKQPAIGIPEKG